MSVLGNIVAGARDIGTETLSVRWAFWAGIFLGLSAGSHTGSAWLGLSVGMGIFILVGAIFGAVREAIVSAHKIIGK